MPQDTWPTSARDTTQFPTIKTVVEMRDHLKGFLTLDGVAAKDYEVQKTKTGLSVEDQRLRTYRKMYERLGLLYVQSDKIFLTDLGKAISSLESSINKERTEQESKLRRRAIDILSRYQLQNPAEAENDVPASCDVLPYMCIWKAMLELDNKLHHEELNRVILRVMRMADLDAAILKIREARQKPVEYGHQSPNDMRTNLGDRVQEDQPPARMAAWFSLAGWGGLIIEREERKDGFRHLVEDSIPLLTKITSNPPHYYPAKNVEDWTRHYLWGSDMTQMIEQFRHDLEDVGLHYARDLVKRFIASCLSKPFVILTGLTGSGKTKLAQAFAKWITPATLENQGDNYNVLIPVGADWIGKENLLGYPDALDESKYVRTPLLDILLHSLKEEDLPHFVILDEMNLSHVERYFADFLSAIESGEPVHLYSCKDPADHGQWRDSIPPAIERFPSNLIIVGTVNVDETTYMFSPKVLDRAHTIEFRMDRSEVASFLASPKKINFSQLSGKGASYAPQFMEWHDESMKISDADIAELRSELQLFFDVLSEFESEFGFRVMDDMFRFLHYYKRLSSSWDIRNAIDVLIYQKILPKLNGSQRKLQPVLFALAILCYRSDGPQLLAERAKKAHLDLDLIDKLLDDNAKEFLADKAYYPLSYAKIRRMLKRLTENGFTSFAEA